MTKRDYINEVTRLEKRVTDLEAQLPLKSFEVRTSDGDEVEVKGHGFSDHQNIVNVWIHPWSNVAVFKNPIYIKEK